MTVQPLSPRFTANQSFGARLQPKEGHPKTFEKFTEDRPVAAQSIAQPKTGPVQGVKNFIGAAQELWVRIDEYTRGTANGIINGGILGGLTYSVVWAKNDAKKATEKATEKAAEKATETATEKGKFIKSYMKAIGKAIVAPFKAMPKLFNTTLKEAAIGIPRALWSVAKLPNTGVVGKTAVVAAGLAGFGATLFRASLNVSDRTAKIEHRWNTDHRYEQ